MHLKSYILIVNVYVQFGLSEIRRYSNMVEVFLLEFRYFLKVDMESLCLMFKGSEFQSLIVAGRKELKKRFFLACNVHMSFALRRL